MLDCDRFQKIDKKVFCMKYKNAFLPMLNTVLGYIMFPNKFLGHLLIVNMVENHLKQNISFHTYFEIIK